MRRWAWRIVLTLGLLLTLVGAATAAGGENSTPEDDADSMDYYGTKLEDKLFRYRELKPESIDFQPGIDADSQFKLLEVAAFVGTKNDKNITVPDLFEDGIVVSVGANVFTTEGSGENPLAKENDVRSITLPNSIKHIGKNAFSGAKNMTSIEIPGEVIIEKYAFEDCAQLRKILIKDFIAESGDIAENGTTIGEGAFKGCTSLDSVILPNSVNTIRANAFQNCSQLKEIVIPRGVRTIKADAFSECYALRYVTFIPRDLTIEEGAFEDEDETGNPVIELIHCEKNSPIYNKMAKLYNEYDESGTFKDPCNGKMMTVQKVHVFAPATDTKPSRLKGCSTYDRNGELQVKFTCEGTTEIVETGKIIEVPDRDDKGNPIPADPDPDTGKVDPEHPYKTHPEMEKKESHTACGHFISGKNDFINCSVSTSGNSAAVTQTRPISSPYHKPVVADDIPATCTNPKFQGKVTCSICEQTLVEPMEIGKPLGHVYYQVKLDENGEEVWDAETNRPVMAEGAEENEKVYTTIKEPTCVETGREEITQHCERCGEDIKLGENELDLIDHTFRANDKPTNFVELKAAACTENGLKVAHLECTVCHARGNCDLCAAYEAAIEDGKTEISDLKIPVGWEDKIPAPDADSAAADGENGEKDSAVPNLPIVASYLKHLEEYHSKLHEDENHKRFYPAAAEIIPALGHLPPANAETEIVKAPTCTEDGLKRFLEFVCEREGCDVLVSGDNATRVISKRGHHFVYKPELDEIIEPATCVSGGLKNTYQVCDNENCPLKGEPQLKEANVPIKPTPDGHKWGEFDPDGGPEAMTPNETCVSKEVTGKVKCTVCGLGEERTLTIEGLGKHTWGEWKADEGGKTETRTCSVCKKTETRNVSAPEPPDDPDDPDDPDKPDKPGEPEKPKDYSITVVPSAGGTASASSATAKSGASITLTVTPSSGYELDMMRAISGGTSVLTLTDLGGGKYRFTMPENNVEIRVTFARKSEGLGWGGVSKDNSTSGDPRRTTDVMPTQNPVQSVPRAGAYEQLFRDIPMSHWAAGEINWANQMGYMNGAGGRFNPDGNITHQQMWMVLARLTGNHPASMTEARRWAVDHSFADGSSPTGPVLRHQLVTALYRCAHLMGSTNRNTTSLAGYPDSRTVPTVARDAFSWAVANGIVGGTGNGRLAPNGTLTRAQFAVILYRYSQQI